MTLPKMPTGGNPRPEALEAYFDEVMPIFKRIEAYVEETGFKYGARGWCYWAEGERLIDKGEFGSFEALLDKAVKRDWIDPDVIADDQNRIAYHIEEVDNDDPAGQAGWAMSVANSVISGYRPISVWDDRDTYVEVSVEKKDLLQLFAPVCERYSVPMTNFRGDTDRNSRRRMLIRGKKHWKEGRNVVLLHFGDHDPKGIHIAETLKKNLQDCGNIRDVQWDADPVRVIRAGLTRQQIDEHGLTWIDNLQTSSGKRLDDPRHADHFKDYVQSYLSDHGSRKVEANALAANPLAARAIIDAAINRFIDPDDPDRFEEKLVPHREAAADELRRLIEGSE